jgi:histone H3/H4
MRLIISLAINFNTKMTTILKYSGKPYYYGDLTMVDVKKSKESKKDVKKAKSIISKSAVVKIAKKNGAERIGKDAAIKLVEQAEKFIGELTKKAIAAASHANRKSIRGEDIDFVTK